PFKELFYNVDLYTVLIIGAPLYGVVTTYLFNREYVENTIKNILTIPVSRVSFIMSKTLLLFICIMMLTMIYWFLNFFLVLIMKKLLTLLLSRVSFIINTTLLLFMCIMMLTMIAWFLTLFLGLLTQFDGLDISLLVESFKEFSIGGVLLFILSTPIILVTLVM